MPEKSLEENLSSELENLDWLESYIRSFWAFLPIAVCYANLAFNILEVSNTLEKLSGFKTLEIVGQNLKKLFAIPKEFDEVQEEIKKKRFIKNKKVILFSSKGKRIIVNLSALPRRDENSDIIGYFFAFLDITKKEEFEKKLKEKIKELEKFYNLTIGRELKMIELKQENKKLKEELKNRKIKGGKE